MATGAETIGMIGIKIASPIVGLAYRSGKARLGRIKEADKATARATIAYLEVAADLMTALEAEADQIFLTGMLLAPSAPDVAEQRKALMTRLNAFVYGEYLRPLLGQAIGALKPARNALNRDAKRFFGKLPGAKDKRRVVKKLDDLFPKLENYMEKINGPHSETPSGPWRYQLLQVREALEAGDDEAASQIARTTLNTRQPIAVVRSLEIGELTGLIRSTIRS